MKKHIVLFLVVCSLQSLSQNNEILTLSGITTSQFFYDQSSVFQFKYERKLGRSINLQAGLRYHSEIQQNTWDGISKWVQSAFNSYKLDATFLIIPINKERFKLKTGLGFDVGLSNYYWAGKGVTQTEQDFNDDNKLIYRDYTYWRYDIDKIPDIGVHFVLQGNYFFKNNLFVATQILYNFVFDDQVANPKFSKTLYRESPLCLSVGLGFSF
jgi:hypothetical protein